MRRPLSKTSVFLAEPNQTPYDLHFSVLGFPVRVHPLFWLMGLIMGFGDVMSVFISIVVAFVSILIHELGHALGLGHGNDRGGVMYPVDLGVWTFSPAESRALRYLHARCG